MQVRPTVSCEADAHNRGTNSPSQQPRFIDNNGHRPRYRNINGNN